MSCSKECVIRFVQRLTRLDGPSGSKMTCNISDASGNFPTTFNRLMHSSKIPLVKSSCAETHYSDIFLVDSL